MPTILITTLFIGLDGFFKAVKEIGLPTAVLAGVFWLLIWAVHYLLIQNVKSKQDEIARMAEDISAHRDEREKWQEESRKLRKELMECIEGKN